MNSTLPDVVFQWANSLALAGWLWLIVWLFLPAALRQRSTFVGLVMPVVLGVVYAATMMVHFSAAQGSFDSLSGVMSLFSHSGATLGGWVHYLAFDLFVGWCISRHAIPRGIKRLVVVVCLFFTFLLGPVGLLMYGAIFIAARVVSQWAGLSEPGHALWRRIIGGQSALAQCGVFLLLLLPVLLVAMSMDTRTLEGINVWVKPAKFAFALIVYTLTLSWYSTYLKPAWRTSWWFRGFSMIVVVAILLEMIWLITAAALGQPSHFNQQHALLASVYPLMGVIATVLTAQSLVIGVGLLKSRTSDLANVTRYCLAYGLVVTFVLTMVTASYLASVPAQSHAVLPAGAVTTTVVDTFPLTGWLRSAGDLRVAHFFATHAMHFVPFFGWCLACIGVAQGTGSAHRAALIISAVFSVFVAFVFVQALNAQPFL